MVDKEKLESLLVTNWTRFINPNRFISFVLESVRDAELNYIDKECPIKSSNVNITISKFDLQAKTQIWADFIVPKQNYVAVGTIEINLNLSDGSILNFNIFGNLFNNYTH